MKMIGNVSDWLSYAGGALIKVADSAGSTVLYILVHGTRNILDILLLYRKLQFKTLNLFKNVTFLNLHVYRLKERTFQTSIFIALPIEDGEIDQNVDCYLYSP